MNGQNFRQLAAERVEDAKALVDAHRWGSAFYVGGYAIECALKACICKNIKAGEFPPRKTEKIYTHDLPDLVKSADLQADLDREQNSNPAFQLNWKTVEDWSEEDRYRQKTETAARDFVDAIGDPKDGVLQWLGRFW